MSQLIDAGQEVVANTTTENQDRSKIVQWKESQSASTFHQNVQKTASTNFEYLTKLKPIQLPKTPMTPKIKPVNSKNMKIKSALDVGNLEYLADLQY